VRQDAGDRAGRAALPGDRGVAARQRRPPRRGTRTGLDPAPRPRTLSGVSRPRQAHHVATRVMSLIMVALGAAMIVSALVRGGGVLAVGVVFGVLFIAAGGARLYLQRRQHDA